MAVKGPFKVEHDEVFPHGCDMHSVAMKRDFNASSKGNPVQAKDKESGKLLWVVTVIDRDAENPNPAMKVNVAADHQPVPPVSGERGAVEFVGLRAMPYVEKKGDMSRLAFSLRADSLAAPSANGKVAPKKEAV